MNTTKLSRGERTWLMACGALLITGILAGLFAFFTAGSGPVGDPHTTVSVQPAVSVQDLNGEWNAESNGVKLVATVASEKIHVKMVNGDTTINWWDGSFVSSAQPGDAVASIKDQSADIMVMSSDNDKTFLVGNGTLTFDMSFMGVTKTVKMTHV